MIIYEDILSEVTTNILHVIRSFTVEYTKENILKCLAPIGLDIGQFMEVLFSFEEIYRHGDDVQVLAEYEHWFTTGMDLTTRDLRIKSKTFKPQDIKKCIDELPILLKIRVIWHYWFMINMTKHKAYKSKLQTHAVYINKCNIEAFDSGETIGCWFISNDEPVNCDLPTEIIKIDIHTKDIIWCDDSCGFIQKNIGLY